MSSTLRTTNVDRIESVRLLFHNLFTIAQKDYPLPGTLLEKLNSSSSSVVSPNPLLNIGHERLPGPVEPPTERTTDPPVHPPDDS